MVLLYQHGVAYSSSGFAFGKGAPVFFKKQFAAAYRTTGNQYNIIGAAQFRNL